MNAKEYLSTPNIEQITFDNPKGFLNAVIDAVDNQDYVRLESIFFMAKSESENGTTASWQIPPIHFAARFAEIYLFERLRTLGISVHTLDILGNTTLHHASFGGDSNEKVVDYLVENAVPINMPEALNGETALHIAAAGGHEKMLRKLLINNADVLIRDFRNLTAANKARANKHYELTRLLLTKQVEQSSRNGFIRRYVIH